jgi:hypothetical protein
MVGGEDRVVPELLAGLRGFPEELEALGRNYVSNSLGRKKDAKFSMTPRHVMPMSIRRISGFLSIFAQIGLNFHRD